MDIRSGIIATAQSLGIDPLDLATAISYETAGTFNPTKAGPTTQWGRHRGLIQFGEPQAKKYGVKWDDPLASQLGPDGAVARYLRDTGVKPGMGLLDVYSAINAGGVGRYNRTDANNGGAPGTVRDKVEQQMAGHRAKAAKLLGGEVAVSTSGGMSGGGGQTTMTGGSGADTMQQERKNLLFPNMDPGLRDRLIVGLEGLTMNPNQAAVAAAQGRMQGRVDQGKVNATAEWLRANGSADLADALATGAVDPGSVVQAHMARQEQQQQAAASSQKNAQLAAFIKGASPQAAEMLAAGVITGEQALSMARDSSNGGQVRAQEILEDGTVIQSTDAGPRVYAPDGTRLEGEAASSAIKSARQFGVDNQRAIYGGRREGTLGADIAMGGTAESAKESGKIAANLGKEAYDNYQATVKSLGTIDEAIAAIDSGAQSGAVAKYLPNVSLSSASLENAMNRMGLDVIGSVTFGALSEGEMRLAMDTAVPRDLSPPELRKWLERKRDAQAKAAEALYNAGRYLSTPGNTLQTWMETQRQPIPVVPAAPTNGAAPSDSDLFSKYGISP